VPEPERAARLREIRVTARLLLGPEHGATRAFTEAIVDPGALGHALDELAALPGLPRPRLLATLASVLR
jgi:hypothetical protein